MAEATVREWLDLWHGLLGDPSMPPFNEPDDMAGVLAELRRYPDRLANAFAPLPCGDELLSRVKLCIDAEKHHDGIYLVPDALDTTDDELRALVADAILRGSQSCGIDPPAYPINMIRRSMTPSESRRAAPIVEELGDLYIGFAYVVDLLPHLAVHPRGGLVCNLRFTYSRLGRREGMPQNGPGALRPLQLRQKTCQTAFAAQLS